MPPRERNVILVNKRQRGNPLLKLIRDVPWEIADVKPDYVPNATCGVMFLSMRYHNLHPEYIHDRVKRLGSDYAVRILLVWADIENMSETIKELSQFSITRQLTMLMAWSPEEAAMYITQFRKRSNTTGQSIQGHTAEVYEDQLVDVLTKIPRITKPDVLSLGLHYGNFRNIVRFSDHVEDLEGWGPTKSAKFSRVMIEPFIMTEPFKKRNVGEPKPLSSSAESTEPSGKDVNHAEQATASSGTIPGWAVSSSIIDRRTMFSGKARRIHSETEAKDVISDLLRDKYIASATANMYAYRLSTGGSLQRYQDAGEVHGGETILNTINDEMATDVVVVVSRWYGGVLLGPTRFQYIRDCTREALERLSSA